MKHSKRARKDPRHQNGYTKSKKTKCVYLSPHHITVEEMFEEREVFTKENMDIHDMNIH